MGNPVIRFENGQTTYPFEEAANSGDDKVFSASFAPISDAGGNAELGVKPYGLMTGGAITPTGVNDEVAVAALTASMAGATGADADGTVVVAGGNLTASRGATTNTHRITSLTVDSTGALAAVAGVAHTAFSETRGANGGPPFIPVGSIEIGQVRTTSVTAGAISALEIFTTTNVHLERAGFPTFTLDRARGEVEFGDALPLIHTGGVPKKVFIKGSTPIFEKIPFTSDWVPAETTVSLSSVDTYDGPQGSESFGLGTASFTVIVKDGITEPIIGARKKNLWFEYRPDSDKTVPRQLTQGTLAIARTNPAGGGSKTVSCTIAPRQESVDIKA